MQYGEPFKEAAAAAAPESDEGSSQESSAAVLPGRGETTSTHTSQFR